MKRTIIIILITMLVLPMLFADTSPVANATLTLQTKVRDIVMHGFSTQIPPAGDSGVLEPIDIFGYLINQHGNSDEFDGNYNPISYAKDNTIDYNDIGDFDFGDPDYDIGYYMFLGNAPTGFTVSFKVTDFIQDGVGANADTVSWGFGYEQIGGFNMSTSGTKVSSGGASFTPVIFSTNSNSIKWAILKLEALFEFEEEVYVSSGTYTATVVAHITTN
ncbi:MAG: hypothetical protein ACOXZZ_00090 [Sphaerochaetaceae bacterium]